MQTIIIIDWIDKETQICLYERIGEWDIVFSSLAAFSWIYF